MIRDIQFQERFLSLKQILMKKATDLCKEDDGKKELLKFHGVDANIDDTKGKKVSVPSSKESYPGEKELLGSLNKAGKNDLSEANIAGKNQMIHPMMMMGIGNSPK